MPWGNQRLETRHLGTPKGTCRARLPPIFTLCYFKIDVLIPHLRIVISIVKSAQQSIGPLPFVSHDHCMVSLGETNLRYHDPASILGTSQGTIEQQR
jgi:hypothetical protein